MTTWPSSNKAVTTTTDADTDTISGARTDINKTISNVNDIIDIFNIPASPTNDYILKYDTGTGKFQMEQDTGTGGSGGLAFKNIDVDGLGLYVDDDYVVTDYIADDIIQADITEDTLTLEAGSNITFTQDTATDTITISATGIGLTDLSVTQNSASGTGTLSYDNTTGLFTYTPPDLTGFLTSETNDLSASVTWANVPDANITQSSVTQHQSALSITESQISDLGSYLSTTGGTMSGAIAMGTNKITNLGTPSIGTDAATKAYVDTTAASGTSFYSATFAGTTYTPDADNGNVQYIKTSSTSNITIDIPTNLGIGGTFKMIILQNNGSTPIDYDFTAFVGDFGTTITGVSNGQYIITRITRLETSVYIADTTQV